MMRRRQVLAALLAAPWSRPLLAQDARVVFLATTTSTENSGLLEELVPAAEVATGFEYRVIAVGTGKALRMGQAGDVDLLMVHARDDELRFVEQGYGVGRTEIMYNDFVIVGPASDPAGLAGAQSAVEALTRIHAGEALFVSRGDDSGTHKKELSLWSMAGLSPSGDWYREVGQGMGKTLQIAGELGGYTISDRGTWIFAAERTPLEIRFEGDPPLHNQYSVMAVNPALHDVNHAGAMAFIQWITSPDGQALIDGYRINGQQLFIANAG